MKIKGVMLNGHECRLLYALLQKEKQELLNQRNGSVWVDYPIKLSIEALDRIGDKLERHINDVYDLSIHMEVRK